VAVEIHRQTAAAIARHLERYANELYNSHVVRDAPGDFVRPASIGREIEQIRAWARRLRIAIKLGVSK
jgi:hypothetical protein